MPKQIDCNLCGSQETSPLFETEDLLFDLPGRFTYVVCKQCRLQFLNPQPDWEERLPHYDLKYHRHYSLAEEASKWERISVEIGLRKQYRVFAHRIKQGRLLDSGCGTGDFAGWMKKQPDWKVFGAERNGEAAYRANAVYGVPIFCGDQTALGMQSSSLDVISLWSVVEHLENPSLGIRECYRILKPGGLLVVRTLNFESLAAHIFGPAWLGYDAPRVLFVFSRSILVQLLTRAGFNVIESRDYFHDYFPYLWSLHNLRKLNSRSHSELSFLVKVAASLPARMLSMPFFALQNHLGKNSFVTLIAQK